MSAPPASERARHHALRERAEARAVPARLAVAAAVSHSSRRSRVNPTRTSVTMMACSMSYAWLARKAACSAARAAASRTSSTAARHRAGRRQRGQQRHELDRRPETPAPRARWRSRPRRAGQQRPSGQQQRDGRRRHQAAPQVVEDLPARDERKPVALPARSRRHDRQQPAAESASRRAPSGAAASRARARSTGSRRRLRRR